MVIMQKTTIPKKSRRHVLLIQAPVLISFTNELIARVKNIKLTITSLENTIVLQNTFKSLFNFNSGKIILLRNSN